MLRSGEEEGRIEGIGYGNLGVFRSISSFLLVGIGRTGKGCGGVGGGAVETLEMHGGDFRGATTRHGWRHHVRGTWRRLGAVFGVLILVVWGPSFPRSQIRPPPPPTVWTKTWPWKNQQTGAMGYCLDRKELVSSRSCAEGNRTSPEKQQIDAALKIYRLGRLMLNFIHPIAERDESGSNQSQTNCMERLFHV